MGQDVKYNGKVYLGVEGVALPLVGGGEVVFPYIDGTTATAPDVASGKTFVKPDGTIGTGTYVYPPYGDGPELIATYDMGTTKLADTLYNGWTPANSAKSIKAASNLGTFTADMSNYEYFTKMVFESNTEYVSGTTIAFAALRQIIVGAQYMYRKPNNLTKMLARDDGYNYATVLYTAPWIEYKGGSGNLTMAWKNSIGIYGSMSANTFSSTSSTSPTVTVKAPVYYAKCDDSYFNTAMAAAVDQNASTIKCKVYVYRIKRHSSPMYQMFNEIVGIYNA